jgi:hypothetical protein
MQKDVHFHVTYVLAKKAGLAAEEARHRTGAGRIKYGVPKIKRTG